MKRKIVITGANSGIGYQIAKELLLQGDFVILFCRTDKKCKRTKEQLISDTGSDFIDTFYADFKSFASVIKAGKLFKEKYSSLDVLINNAGGTFSNFSLTEDKIEVSMQVNHLSPFLLTYFLLDALKKSKKARIINTASIAHFKGRFDKDIVNDKEKFHVLKNYNNSKLANILFTYKLAEKLKETNITVNCLDPGIVKTKIGNKSGNFFHKIVWQLYILFKGSSIEKGASTSLFLINNDRLDNISSKYYVNKKETQSSAVSYDINTQNKIWAWSEEKTAINY